MGNDGEMTGELELILFQMYDNGWFYVHPIGCSKWYANYQILADMGLVKKKMVTRGGRFMRESLTAKGIRKAISIEKKRGKTNE